MAHIETDRSVTFYDDAMPEEVRRQIEAVAASPDTGAFGFAPAPEAAPVPEPDVPQVGDRFTQLGEQFEIECADELVSAKKVGLDDEKSSGTRDYAHYTRDGFEEQIENGGIVLEKEQADPAPTLTPAWEQAPKPARAESFDAPRRPDGRAPQLPYHG